MMRTVLKAVPLFVASVLLLCACMGTQEQGVPPAAVSAASAEAQAPQLLFVPQTGGTAMVEARRLLEGQGADLQAEIAVSGPTVLFQISREKPYGTRLLAVAGSAGQEFIQDFTMPGILDEYEDLTPPFCAQFSTLDLDADGTLEIAVSIGDRAAQMQTLVYRYAGGALPFEMVGAIDGQVQMTQRDNEILAPNTDAALSMRYAYSLGGFEKTAAMQ